MMKIYASTLAAKPYWHDYCLIRNSEAYQAVASNISGSTLVALFEDVSEELDKKYHDDKAHVKDALEKDHCCIDIHV